MPNGYLFLIGVAAYMLFNFLARAKQIKAAKNLAPTHQQTVFSVLKKQQRSQFLMVGLIVIALIAVSRFANVQPRIVYVVFACLFIGFSIWKLLQQKSQFIQADLTKDFIQTYTNANWLQVIGSILFWASLIIV